MAEKHSNLPVFTSFLSEKLKNLPIFPDFSGKKLKYVQKTLQFQVQITHSLAISDENLSVIAGHLRHNPNNWVYIQSGTRYYLEILKQIKEVLSQTELNHPIILEHPEAHWVLVIVDDTLLPVILVRGFEFMGVYKTVTGKACRWLETMKDDALKIVANQYITPGVIAGSKEDPHRHLFGGLHIHG